MKQIKEKKLSPEHIQKLIKANTGRVKSEYELEICKNNISVTAQEMKNHTGSYHKMMDSLCPYKYEVYLNGKKQYECLGKKELENYCNTELKISRTIMWNIVRTHNWKPKFNKHKHLETLDIIRIDRSVSTNPDECRGVE